MIPALDVGATYTELRPEIDAAIERVLASGWYVLGPEVEAFERDFAAYCGTRECVGVASGLDALELILRALDIGPGDEVIVPSNTYIATWLAVTAVGATPVPVEPDVETHNLRADAVSSAIGSRTAAVLAVHLYGRAVEAGPLRALCDRHGVALLEDAAQAHGATTPQGRTGALGRAAAFSFYPTKNLGAFGDAGAVTTNDPELAERIRVLRNYGSPRKYTFEVAGRNSRLDPLQAAVLAVKLPHLDDWNARRRALARRYAERLDGLPGVMLPAAAGDDHVHHLQVVRCTSRDVTLAALRDRGVDAQVHYPIPPHRSGVYESDQLHLPLADWLAAEVLSLPIGPHLEPTAVDSIADAMWSCELVAA